MYIHRNVILEESLRYRKKQERDICSHRGLSDKTGVLLPVISGNGISRNLHIFRHQEGLEIPPNLSRNIIPFAAVFSIIPLLEERSFLSRWKSSRETLDESDILEFDFSTRVFFPFPNETFETFFRDSIKSFAGRRLIPVSTNRWFHCPSTAQRWIS